MTWSLTHPNNESDRRARETDTAERDDDPTPRPVIRAVFRSAEPVKVARVIESSDSAVISVGGRCIEVSADRPLRVLDVGAGYGAWSGEFARHWVLDLGLPREWLHITGVEICEARREHLDKWCDEVIIEDWRMAMCVIEDSEDGQVDIIIGNPPFSHILRQGKNGKKRTPYKPVSETMVPTLLGRAPAVFLFHQVAAFDDSGHGREVWRKYKPAAEWKCGRVALRGGSNTDSRTYTASLWLRDYDGQTAVDMLPELPDGARRWEVEPGSELPSDDMPAAPGWTP